MIFQRLSLQLLQVLNSTYKFLLEEQARYQLRLMKATEKLAADIKSVGKVTSSALDQKKPPAEYKCSL